MKKKSTPKEVFQPDDNFFKKVMEDKENAQAYLVEFYPNVARQLDLTSLEIQPDGFLTEEFRLFKSDVVYRCKLLHDDKQLYLTLVWENKSKPKREVAIQLGLYIFLAMNKMINDRSKVLEPILPMVFYNGKKKWEPLTIKELFRDYAHFDVIEPFLPNFHFLFKDINKTPTEELLKIETAFFRSAMVAMANKYKTFLIFQTYSVIFDLEREQQLDILFTYLCGIMEESPQDVRKKLEGVEFTNKNKFMSTLEMLRKEGRVEGEKIGREEGEKIGGKFAKGLANLTTLFNAFKIFPQISLADAATLANLPISFVEKAKDYFVHKNEVSLFELVQQELFLGIELNVEKKAKITQIIGEALQQQS